MSTEKTQILIVDDEEGHAEAVADALHRGGYECTICADADEAKLRMESEPFDIILTDLHVGTADGMEILRKAKQELPDAEVIIITGRGTIRTAVTAMQQGAHTYLTKPLDIGELRQVVSKATERQRLRRTNLELRQQLNERFGFEGVVGNSLAMNKVITRLRLVSPSSATVLVLGENGTGKELVARAIHNNSPRKHKPFVALNCAALSESILESELFGHERGAFTGADRMRKGRFEYANGGTLFLDEVGDLPMATQIKLLRVIENREIMRVGSNDSIPVNVRLVSATNRDIVKMVEAGDFRQDLYYRLKVVTILLPPLRERLDDIPLLSEHFLKEFAELHGKPVPTVSTPVMRVLRSHSWPGNVRELRNTLESMVVIDQDGRLDIDDLPDELQGTRDESVPVGQAQDSLVGQPIKVVEAYYIEQALKLTNGNREEAARILDIGERTLYRKIKDYDIPTGKSERRRRRASAVADE